MIEILVDRRQGAQRCEADGRDPRRNGSVSLGLREIGFTFVRQQAPFQHIAGRRPAGGDVVALPEDLIDLAVDRLCFAPFRGLTVGAVAAW